MLGPQARDGGSPAGVIVGLGCRIISIGASLADWNPCSVVSGSVLGLMLVAASLLLTGTANRVALLLAYLSPITTLSIVYLVDAIRRRTRQRDQDKE